VTGRWFSPGTPVFSNNKTDRHDIIEILFIVESGVKHYNPNNFLKYEYKIDFKSFMTVRLD